MNQSDKMQLILHRMILLLELSNINDWADCLKIISNQFARSPDDAKRKILSLYGGMGSLNDLLLQKDGVLFKKENEEFDTLKSKLFNICHKI